MFYITTNCFIKIICRIFLLSRNTRLHNKYTRLLLSQKFSLSHIVIAIPVSHSTNQQYTMLSQTKAQRKSFDYLFYTEKFSLSRYLFRMKNLSLFPVISLIKKKPFFFQKKMKIILFLYIFFRNLTININKKISFDVRESCLNRMFSKLSKLFSSR